jgi:hypothetical protein
MRQTDDELQTLRTPWYKNAVPYLATGGFGALVGGPVGLIAGLGLARYRDLQNQSNTLAHAREDADMLNKQDRLFTDTLSDASSLKGLSETDQKVLHKLQGDYQAYSTMGMHSDPQYRQTAVAGMMQTRDKIGAFMQSIDARNEAQANKRLEQQSDMIKTGIAEQRQRAEAMELKRDEMRSATGQLSELLNDPSFDPSKAENAGQLRKMLSTFGGRALVQDTPGFADALQAAGAGLPLVSNITGYLAGKERQKDFAMSRGDWQTLAKALTKYEERHYADQTKQIRANAESLDPHAKRLGLLPENLSASDYILGVDPSTRPAQFNQVEEKPKVEEPSAFSPETKGELEQAGSNLKRMGVGVLDASAGALNKIVKFSDDFDSAVYNTIERLNMKKDLLDMPHMKEKLGPNPDISDTGQYRNPETGYEPVMLPYQQWLALKRRRKQRASGTIQRAVNE